MCPEPGAQVRDGRENFGKGKGRVLHMLGHVYQMEGNLKGTFSAQRLMANFLIAAVRKQ